MKSGISRYTLGGFNQSALDDVYNKAKEIYQDEAAPPVSGIVQVTLDSIWGDMTLPHDYRPLISPWGLSQTWGPVPKDLYSHGGGLVPWTEVEEASDFGLTDSNVGCEQGHGISQSSNTVVEKGHSYFYIKRNGVWSLMKKSGKVWEGQDNPLNDAVRLGCGVPWRAQLGGGCLFEKSPDGFDTMMPSWKLNNDGSKSFNEGAYQHPFQQNTTRPILPANAEHCVHIIYYRLILRDPNGVDDRHLARFITHESLDIYRSDDLSYIGDIGISRYKSVTNDWVANSLTTMDPNMTEQEFMTAMAGLEPLLPKNP